MTYTWRFKTAGDTSLILGRGCFIGPMIDVEVVMSRPFTYMTQFEEIRARLLPVIIDSSDESGFGLESELIRLAVATREVTLRAMNSLLAPVFSRLLPQKDRLQVVICNKRHCVDIEYDLRYINKDYVTAASLFPKLGLLKEQVALIEQALMSESPVVRVAGKSAVVLLASYMEMDRQNG